MNKKSGNDHRSEAEVDMPCSVDFALRTGDVTISTVLDSEQVDMRLELYRGQVPFPKAKS